MEDDLKLITEYELVLSSYLYHALTTFALRGIPSCITEHFKSLTSTLPKWPPFKNILGGVNLVNRHEDLLTWMGQQVESAESDDEAEKETDQTSRETPSQSDVPGQKVQSANIKQTWLEEGIERMTDTQGPREPRMTATNSVYSNGPDTSDAYFRAYE